MAEETGRTRFSRFVAAAAAVTAGALVFAMTSRVSLVGHFLSALLMFFILPAIVAGLSATGLIHIRQHPEALTGRKTGWALLAMAVLFLLAGVTSPNFMKRTYHYDRMHELESALAVRIGYDPSTRTPASLRPLFNNLAVTLGNTLTPSQCSAADLRSIIHTLPPAPKPLGLPELLDLMDRINAVSTADDDYFFGRCIDLCSIMNGFHDSEIDTICKAYPRHQKDSQASGRAPVPIGAFCRRYIEGKPPASSAPPPPP